MRFHLSLSFAHASIAAIAIGGCSTQATETGTDTDSGAGTGSSTGTSGSTGSGSSGTAGTEGGSSGTESSGGSVSEGSADSGGSGTSEGSSTDEGSSTGAATGEDGTGSETGTGESGTAGESGESGTEGGETTGTSSGEAGEESTGGEREFKYVFVSSMVYTGLLGGLGGADGKCRDLAEAADLPGTYKAWLSAAGVHAAERLAHSELPYRRVDGETVADDFDDVLDQTLAAAISIDENGDAHDNSLVWTATFPNGNVSGTDCSAWTTYSGEQSGGGGNSGQSDGEWTSFDVGDTDTWACVQPRRLYCFEQ